MDDQQTTDTASTSTSTSTQTASTDAISYIPKSKKINQSVYKTADSTSKFPTPIITAQEFFNLIKNRQLNDLKQVYYFDDYLTAKNDDNSLGLTALHIACENDDVSMLRWLLSEGATHDIKNNNRETPLDYALSNFKPRAYKFLLEYLFQKKFSLTIEKEEKYNNDLITLFKIKKLSSDKKFIAHYLIENNADLKITNTNSRSLSEMAVNRSDLDLVEFLLERNAFVLPDEIPDNFSLKGLISDQTKLIKRFNDTQQIVNLANKKAGLGSVARKIAYLFLEHAESKNNHRYKNLSQSIGNYFLINSNLSLSECLNHITIIVSDINNKVNKNSCFYGLFLHVQSYSKLHDDHEIKQNNNKIKLTNKNDPYNDSVSKKIEKQKSKVFDLIKEPDSNANLNIPTIKHSRRFQAYSIFKLSRPNNHHKNLAENLAKDLIDEKNKNMNPAELKTFVKNAMLESCNQNTKINFDKYGTFYGLYKDIKQEAKNYEDDLKQTSNYGGFNKN